MGESTWTLAVIYTLGKSSGCHRANTERQKATNTHIQTYSQFRIMAIDFLLLF